MAENEKDQAQTPSVEDQAAQQTGQRQVRLRIDESKMGTNYANAFRTGATAEEVMLDFGLNQVGQTPGGNGKKPMTEILFLASNRVVLNYYTAKRLAITLSQLVRRHEEQFGELKLNVQDRMAKS